MRPSLSLLSLALLPFTLAQNIPTYFVITSPAKGDTLSNNAANLVQWTAAVDSVPTGVFDVELARLSTSGLLLVANNVPISLSGLNILLQDVPNGDDYFLMFIDVTNGISWATSSRFSIQASNGTTPNTNGALPTATISGSPNPTAGFGTIFAPAVTGAARQMLANFAGLSPAWAGAAVAGISVLLGAELAL